ncbi:MAG: hypothetical protein R2805_07220 [Flavobacterium sp.]|jgi:hypothetical protein|uniref:hypothetical protein n=1 Tax=Flavobacterium sp. TaxID=239 RepID=UPI002C8E7E88|nr:hypothetical protein [Flavobacterium sp.]MCA0347630.1 FUSC family protein [Bacteroidota bacterium]HQA74126.1 hypothetical protein [Flavobacterium sp.]
MIYSVTIALGFVRLCLLVLVLFYLNRKFVNYRKPENIFDFIANQWFKYGSILVILLFTLVQLRIYNLFNTLIIFFFIIVIDYIGMKKLKKALTFSSKKVRKKTFELIKNIELKKDWSYYLTTKTDKSVRKQRLWLMVLLFILGFVTFFSRYYFTKYDVYALSNLWILELEQVVEFNKQNWFLNGVSPVGELAMINFYSKISSISPEIALESMGIIESVLIGVLLFWTISKITTSKIIAPIVACLFFALCYVLSPINIFYILQHKPMFLALSLAIPGMVFYLNPTLLKFNKKNYFYNFVFAFVAIGLVDMFTLLLMVLPFVIIGFIFSKKEFIAHKLIALKAFVISIVLLAIIYGTSCYLIGYDFDVFLNSSLIAASSYTYFPHLILPYNVLMSYYIVASLAIILILLVLTYGFKENWHEAFSFLILFIFLILLSNVKNEWIDNATLKQAIAIYIPIFIGIAIGLLLRILNPIFKKIQFLTPYFAGVLIVAICFAAFHFQSPEFNKLKKSDTTARKILDAYENITSEFFPFSYSVVNDYSTHSISTNQHFFVNYEDFLNNYLDKDYQYFKYRKKIKYLKNHSEIVLPKSVIVFLYKKKATKLSSLAESYKLSSKLKLQLDVLKSRGRKIDIIYSNEIFDVYEIINEPNEARVKNLIFKL